MNNNDLINKLNRIENMIKYTQESFDDFKLETSKRIDILEEKLVKSTTSNSKNKKKNNKEIKAKVIQEFSRVTPDKQKGRFTIVPNIDS